MPPGLGYRDMLSRLHSLVGQDTTARKETISDEFARGLGQQADPVRMGGQYGTEPVLPTGAEMQEQRNAAAGPVTPHEQRLVDRTMAASTPNGSSLDELRNYAMLRSRGAVNAPDPARTPAMVDYEAARQRAIADVNGTGGGGGSIPEAVDPTKAADLAALEQAKQDAIAAMNAPTPAVDPAKAAQLAELEAAGNRTAAEIGAIGTKAPGTARGVANQLEGRRRDILARLATPAATGGANAPNLTQPPDMGSAGFPAQAYPQIASAAPVAPFVPPAPVARYPLVAPPVYPPSPGYPTPGQPQVADLDQAAAAQYARTRLGLGGP